MILKIFLRKASASNKGQTHINQTEVPNGFLLLERVKDNMCKQD